MNRRAACIAVALSAALRTSAAPARAVAFLAD
jgi:hypothetical protein